MDYVFESPDHDIVKSFFEENSSNVSSQERSRLHEDWEDFCQGTYRHLVCSLAAYIKAVEQEEYDAFGVDPDAFFKQLFIDAKKEMFK